MPDYRWGIFLAPSRERKIHFGEHMGEPAGRTCRASIAQPAPDHRHAGRHRARVVEQQRTSG
jgi:hypothetical protein